MDFGVHGKTALVCGASKGLGYACAEALAREGVKVVIAARGVAALQAVAETLRANFNVRVKAVTTDITTEEGRVSALAACGRLLGMKDQGSDVLVTNAGGRRQATSASLSAMTGLPHWMQTRWHR